MQRSSIHLVLLSLVLVIHGARAEETPLSSPAVIPAITAPAPHAVAEEVDRQILAELKRAQAMKIFCGVLRWISPVVCPPRQR